jgi:predicted PurR-regulated permease PerM
MPPPLQELDTDPRLARKRRDLLLLGFAIAVGLIVAWFLRHALLIIYVSAVFATVCKPAVDWLHRRSIFGWRPGRGIALLLLVALLFVFLGGIVALAIPSIVSNVTDFAGTMSQQMTNLQQRLHSFPLLRNVSLADVQSRVTAVLGKVVPAVSAATADIVTGLLLTAYLILDGAALLQRLWRVLPPERRPRLEAALNRAGQRMRRWLAGQAMLMAILGGSAALTFGLMGLPYFYLLALFAGVANIVPLLGPLVTVVLASAVAATQSGWDVLGVLIFYLVYQQVENAFLTPRIMKSQVQLPSSVVILALLIGSELAGIAGALVAVPSAVLVAELANEYLVYRRPPPEPPGG